MLILDKTEPLVNYLNYIVMDSGKNIAYVKRDFTGDLVRDNTTHDPDAYKYENIKWGEPYFAPLIDKTGFNKDDELIIVGKSVGEN